MNKETGQDKNRSDRIEDSGAFAKKSYKSPKITFIEDIEAVASACGGAGGKTDGADCPTTIAS